MATMITEVYDAFLAASVPEPQARKAAEAFSKHDERFLALEIKIADLSGRVNLLTWMVGASIALNIAVLVRLFTL